MKRPVYNALQHLIIAERVCDYVRQKMTKGSPIKPIDIAHSKMRRESQMRGFNAYYNKLPSLLQPKAWQSRPKLDLKLSMVFKQRNNAKAQSTDPFKWIIAQAFFAEQCGIGNSVDQAAVGFKYLCNYTKCKVFTLVRVSPDHVLLVLGVGMGAEGYYRLNKAPDWPEGAVICDPWYNEWFIVEKDWCLKMRLILETTEKKRSGYISSLTTGIIPIQCVAQGPKSV